MMENRRKAARIDALNLLDVGIYDNQKLVRHAMGRTLNVSEGGILLEMHFDIQPEQSVSLTLALEDELVTIKGEVVYARGAKDGKFEIGIHFREINDTAKKVLHKYIDAFKSRA